MADCEHPSFHEQYRDGSGDCVKCAAEELEERLGSVMLERDEKARLLETANRTIAALQEERRLENEGAKELQFEISKRIRLYEELRKVREGDAGDMAKAWKERDDALLQVDALKKAILYVKAEECLSAKGEGVLDKALQPVAETRNDACFKPKLHEGGCRCKAEAEAIEKRKEPSPVRGGGCGECRQSTWHTDGCPNS